MPEFVGNIHETGNSVNEDRRFEPLEPIFFFICVLVDQTQVLKIWENYITQLYDRPNRPETLEVEPEEEVDTDEKGPHILQSEVEKAVNEMRNRKATGEDDIPDIHEVIGRKFRMCLEKISLDLEEGTELGMQSG